MSKSWAISGLDLHLDLPTHRVRAGLEAQLRAAIESGQLPQGTRLPSSRGLSTDLGLARNTVADAYGQLVAEGWLIARPGSGTSVAQRITAPGAAAASPPRAVRPPTYDLRPGSPDVSAFPASAWVAALRRALADAPATALGYSGPRGRPELHEALSVYLARARGVRVSPERIVVCSGFTQGLGLLAPTLCERAARTIAVESYSLPAHRQVLAAHGLLPRPLRIDAQGACVDELANEAGVLLTPAHQFPLGAALAPHRRATVTAWAARHGSIVVEDDYDGEFRYDRQPVGAVQAQAPEHVVYAGTASKSLIPGLRLGWLVLPRDLVEPVTDAKATNDVHSSALDQLALAQLISSGTYDRHIRRCRLAYRRRRDHLVAILRARVPRATVSGIAAGLHALVRLPPGRTESDVVAQAAQRGLAVLGLAGFAAAGEHHHPPALVVGYATPPQHAFTGAVARLATALR